MAKGGLVNTHTHALKHVRTHIHTHAHIHISLVWVYIQKRKIHPTLILLSRRWQHIYWRSKEYRDGQKPFPTRFQRSQFVLVPFLAKVEKHWSCRLCRTNWRPSVSHNVPGWYNQEKSMHSGFQHCLPTPINLHFQKKKKKRKKKREN